MSLIVGKDLVILKAANIFNVSAEGGAQFPYIWTMVTCSFVETNIAFMVMYLLLINYIVSKNRTCFETAWQRKDFMRMLLVTSFLSSMTQLVIRLVLYSITKNAESYNSFEYSSLNLIVMSLLLGLH